MGWSMPKGFEIAEIFYSIQGEGYYTGRPAIFIRFTGCNLTCSFCDEPSHRRPGRFYTLEALLQEVQKYQPCSFVILTGGEPSLQKDLALLVLNLHQGGYYVAMETNGTQPIDCGVDWVSLSPKTEVFIDTADELKLVYQGQDLSKYEFKSFKYFYLQPLNYKNKVNFDSVERCLKVIKKNPKWRLSLQMHKVLDLP